MMPCVCTVNHSGSAGITGNVAVVTRGMVRGQPADPATTATAATGRDREPLWVATTGAHKPHRSSATRGGRERPARRASSHVFMFQPTTNTADAGSRPSMNRSYGFLHFVANDLAAPRP